MDTDELAAEIIEELRETLRALVDNPNDAQAQQRARHLLAITKTHTEVI